MAIVGIIALVIYLALGFAGYKELYTFCRNKEDQESARKFKRKLITHWAEYAFNVGRIRKALRDQTGKDDRVLVTVKFSECFNERDRRAAKLYAELTLSI